MSLVCFVGITFRAHPRSLRRLENHRRGTRAEFGPCLARSAKYSFPTMIVAGALLTLPRCRSERISRRSSACWTSGQPGFASADFHTGNDSASDSRPIGRVHLYAAAAPAARSCTERRFNSEAYQKTASSLTLQKLHSVQPNNTVSDQE